MKNMKKFSAIVLAIVMVLMYAVPVSFAAGEGSITINGTTSGKVYDAYKIFDLTYSGDNVAYTIDSDWTSFFTGSGAGASYIVAENNEGKTLNPINVDGTIKYINITDSNIADFSAAALGYATSLTPDKKETASGTTVSMTGLDLGYYLVYPEGASGKAEGQSSICSLTSTKPSAEVNVKAVYPSVDKSILENGEKVNVNEKSIGDTVTYVIESTVPDTTGYEWYKLTFDDTLSKGLTFGSVTSIKVGSKTLTTSDYTLTAGAYSATAGTNLRFVFGDIIEKEYTAGDKIEITYTATLNENAVIDGPNENEVDLEYSKDPNWTHENEPGTPDFGENEPKGETPKDKTETYTTAIKIIKTDGSSALTGAAFKITGEGVNIVVTTGDVYVADNAGTYWLLKDGTYTTQDPNGTVDGKPVDKTKYASESQKYKKETKVTLDTSQSGVNAEAFVGSDGTLTFTGLGEGEYTITETVVPTGYNKAEDVKFELTFNSDNKTFSSDNEAVKIGNTTNLFETTIVNNAGAELPSTGGIGTTIFYILGAILVLGAGVLLVTRRRMRASEE